MNSRLLLAVATLLLVSSALHAQLITNFGATAFNGGGWTYTAGTSTISGTEGLGDLIFGNSATNIFSNSISLRLTGNAITAPTGSFTITLEDNNLVTPKVATALFFWSDFSGGKTVTSSLSAQSGFNFGNIKNWSLDSGGSGQSVNASFTQLTAVAVPEPSTYALGVTGLLGLFILRRVRRSSRLAA